MWKYGMENMIWNFSQFQKPKMSISIENVIFHRLKRAEILWFQVKNCQVIVQMIWKYGNFWPKTTLKFELSSEIDHFLTRRLKPRIISAFQWSKMTVWIKIHHDKSNLIIKWYILIKHVIFQRFSFEIFDHFEVKTTIPKFRKKLHC